MKPLLTWLLKKTGIYSFIWQQFCDQYPIRIGAETPEVKKFLQDQEKVFTDLMIHGMGCTHYVDPKGILGVPDVVLH